MNLSGFFFFWIVSSSLLSATPTTATPASARPIVAVSVEPLALIVREICADSCEVLTLVPKGVSEHSWQPGPKDVVKVKTAVAAIGVGLSFDERWFEKIGYPTASVLWIGKSLDPMPWWSDDMSASSHKATTHDHAHNSIDPHVWVDARRMSSAATMMGAHLAKLIPMAEAAFKSRSQVFSERVLKLQLEVENRRKLWRTRPVVMFHDLAGYFARRFNLPVLSVSAGSELI
jgi:zinc transport system substrate-binding protein